MTMRLSQFSNQKHITSVLRASVIDGCPLQIVYLVGGDEAEREELADSYRLASICLTPERGDHCGVCIKCRNPTYHRPVEVFVYSAAPKFLPLTAQVFTLNSPPMTNTEAYAEALRLFGRIATGTADGDLMEAAKKYVAAHGPVAPSLTQVVLDILAKKSGAGVLEDSTVASLLANRLRTTSLVAVLDKLWTVPALDPNTSACLLVISLKYLLNPASNVVEPISEVEDTPVTFEELERMAADM